MISEVVMPQMGSDMEEGTVLRWLKKEGDAVRRGEIIAEIETDKANVEIEAFESGVFRRVLATEGTTVPIGQVIALIAAPEDDVSQYGAAPGPAEARRGRAEVAEAKPATTRAAGAPAAPAGRVRASPVARRLAAEMGVDLSQVQGTGPDGRILRRDIEAAKAAQAAKAPPSREPAAAPGAVTTVALSRIRQTIARRMAQSKREAPHYYLTVDIDMTEAQRLRAQINELADKEAHVSVNDLIVKATAKALALHPVFNSWWVDDGLQQHATLNIGIAIALEEGLIAPAILDCGSKSLFEIARASKDLAERARSGVLKAEEYTGGTFTITNLGMFGIEALIGIINPPQTAILGVGALRTVPVLRDGQVTAAELMKVALSADHRATDGAQVARFLQDIRRFLENPAGLLL